MSLDVGVLLAAIACIESNSNDCAMGRLGEVSRYQIMPRNWKVYAKETAPNRRLDPRNPNDAMVVAKLMLRDYRLQLNAINRDDPYAIACAWNWGITRVNRVAKEGGLNPADVPLQVWMYAGAVVTEYERLKNDLGSRGAVGAVNRRTSPPVAAADQTARLTSGAGPSAQ